jgi:hypothetical protein
MIPTARLFQEAGVLQRVTSWVGMLVDIGVESDHARHVLAALECLLSGIIMDGHVND